MYFNVSRAYDIHVAWSKEKRLDYVIEYNAYVKLQYDTIKHMLFYSNNQRQEDVYYIKI